MSGAYKWLYSCEEITDGLVEKNRFFEISRSSLVEIDTQLEIAQRLKYLNKDQLDIIGKKINHIFAMLSNMIKKNQI